jgi:arylsulfatase
MMNSDTTTVEEAGMAQLDDSIGDASAAPGGHRRGRQHHRHLHHRQRRRGLHLARWRHDAVPATKGTVFEGGFRVPAIIRWPGKVKPGTVENGIFSGLDWLPDAGRRGGQSRTSPINC